MRLLPKNPLMRLLSINLAIGAAAGLLVVAGFYVLDIGGIQRLTNSDEMPWVPVIMLIVMFIITLGSAAMGAAIMMLPKDEGGDKGKRVPVGPALLQAVPVRSDLSRAHRTR